MRRIKQKSVGLTIDQADFVENENFDLSKFVRDKLEEYMQERNFKLL